MGATLRRMVGAGIRHSSEWGMIWFGLIFWGSVINAMASQILPAADPALIAWAAYATGFALGAFARARGTWL